MNHHEQEVACADAQSGENGSGVSSLLLPNEPPPLWHQQLGELVLEMRQTNQLLGELCAVNAQLLNLLAEQLDDDEDDEDQSKYLDGTDR